MLNAIWVLMILGAIVCGAATGRMEAVAKASTDAAGAAVTLAIGLVGVMAFWLGLMRVLQEGGMLDIIARGLRPVTTRLFPDVPADSPAMSMMVLNMTSNILGLGNAATPFGLKAMMELDKLNPIRGTATDSMALFLAINTSALAVFPTGMIATRAALGSSNPGAIVVSTLIATTMSTLVAIVVAKSLQRLPTFAMRDKALAAGSADASAGAPGAGGPAANVAAAHDIDTTAALAAFGRKLARPSHTRVWSTGALAAALLALFGYAIVVAVRTSDKSWTVALMQASTDWMLVLLIAGIVLFGLGRGVKIYDAVVEGGKEGFTVALRIIPFLVAILVAVGMLRAAGAIEMLVTLLDPVTRLVGMPAEALPMALLRPLSGSGAYGVASEIMQANGPDSLVGLIVSTMQGSTETTFYVLALYFGVVAVRDGRHTLAACLVADVAGLLGSVWACRLLFT